VVPHVSRLRVFQRGKLGAIRVAESAPCHATLVSCLSCGRSGRVAQLVEQCPFKAWVAGSSPAALTMISKLSGDFWPHRPLDSMIPAISHCNNSLSADRVLRKARTSEVPFRSG